MSKQTPSVGIGFFSSEFFLINSKQIPAFVGLLGPGEITKNLG